MTVDFFINKNLKFIVKDRREPKDYLDRVGAGSILTVMNKKTLFG